MRYDKRAVAAAAGLLILIAGIVVGLSPRSADLHLQPTGQVVAHIACGSHYLPGAPQGPVVADDGRRITGDLTVACDRQNPLGWTVLAWAATLVGAGAAVYGATRLRRRPALS